MQFRLLPKNIYAKIRGSLPSPVFLWFVMLGWAAVLALTVAIYGTLMTHRALTAPMQDIADMAPRKDFIDRVILEEVLHHYTTL